MKKKVGKSKFANNYQQEISDESYESKKNSQQFLPYRQQLSNRKTSQTDEEIHPVTSTPNRRKSKSQGKLLVGNQIEPEQIESPDKKQTCQQMDNSSVKIVNKNTNTVQQQIDSESGVRDSNNCQCHEVIVADDDAFNLMTFQAMLRDIYGIESTGVSNG